MATSPVDSSRETTRARSILTLDGYVSRGKAPPSSVPRDHAMLQDFAAYLELRLQCVNMSLLRRIFADFLNEQEHTLGPMMQQGCTIVTVCPVLRPGARRRQQAEVLLAKPKFHLDARGCVFLYLQYRTATRNMALLKHLFLEFVSQRETALLAFVERGSQVISVIPFELPRLPPPRVEHESPRAVEAAAEQQRGGEGAVVKEAAAKKTRKRRIRRTTATSTSASAPAASDEAGAAATLIVQKRTRGKPRNVGATADPVKRKHPAAREEPGVVPKRRRKSRSAVATSASATSARKSVPPASSPAAGSTTTRSRKPTASSAPLQDAGSAVATEPVASVSTEVLPRVSGEPPKRKGGRTRQTGSCEHKSRERAEEKSTKRGKPVMSDEMIRSQLELARKMETFESESPWEAVYGNLAAPFDEEKHPALALQFRNFWRKYSQAVWERKFWAPMSRKLNLYNFNRRNNRQLTAKNAFESLTISAYREFGAAFFVQLDSQTPRHPGWWYRGPVVALFALQQIRGEDAMWLYVKNEALERFPDCKLSLPLTASNSGAMRMRHNSESASMWMANHQLTAGILREMAALKAEQQARAQQARAQQGEASQATTAVSDREMESAMVEALELV